MYQYKIRKLGVYCEKVFYYGTKKLNSEAFLFLSTILLYKNETS